MTAFDRLDRAAGRVVDRLQGEAVDIIRRLQALPKRPLTADPGRPSLRVIGRLIVDPEDLDIEGRRRGTDLGGHTRFAGEVAQVVIEADAALPLSDEGSVVSGDLLRLPARSAAYVVTRVMRSDLGAVVLMLTREPSP